MSAPAKEAIREALGGLLALAENHCPHESWCEGSDECLHAQGTTALASLDSLVWLTAEEAEKIGAVLEEDYPRELHNETCGYRTDHPDYDPCDACEALALLSGSGRADSEEKT